MGYLGRCFLPLHYGSLQGKKSSLRRYKFFCLTGIRVYLVIRLVHDLVETMS